MKTKKAIYSIVLVVVVLLIVLFLIGMNNHRSNVAQENTDGLTTEHNKPNFDSDQSIKSTIIVNDLLNNDTYQKSFNVSGGYLKISIKNSSDANMTFTLNKNGSNGPGILLGAVDAKQEQKVFYTDTSLEKGDYFITISSGSGKLSGKLSIILGSNLEELKK